MKNKSGILEFGKKEEEAMRTVLNHARIDMSYGSGGSYTSEDCSDVDSKEMEKGKRGIELFEWVLNTYKK